MNNNDKHYYSLETQIHVYDGENEVIEVKTNNEKICLSIDFIFKSSAELEGNLYLLKNFEPCSFSLNGSDYLKSYKINIPSSEKYLSSRNNYIEIKDLDLTSNDMCLILMVDDLIVTKRFQITNTAFDKKNTIENQDYFPVNQKMENISEFMSSYTEFIDFNTNQLYLEDVIKQGRLYCALNIQNKLTNSQFEIDFENRKNEEIQYAIIPIGYNKNYRFLDPIFLKTDSQSFGFEMELSDIDDLSGMRLIIFPFANEYNDNFLSTYKAFLWSNPIITHIIFKEGIQ